VPASAAGHDSARLAGARQAALRASVGRGRPPPVRLLHDPRQDAMGTASHLKRRKKHMTKHDSSKQPVKQFRIGGVSAAI